jgi:hypothetical protein
MSGQTFTVLGRLAYAHAQGTWDEWFIETKDGEIRWLAEDEGELFLESKLELKTPVPAREELQPGMQITLNDKVGVIEEIGEARCIGGEGQIPFPVQIGETYWYADGAGADGSFVFGLEYDSASGVPTVFTGRLLRRSDAKSVAGLGEPAAAKTGEVIRCDSCGKPWEGVRVETTEMIVCDACGANLKLDQAQTKVVAKNQGKKPAFTFEVGTPLTLEKTRYEVMGRLYYVERDESGQYPSYEYVLHNPEEGYLWLSEENGHFTISRPFHQQVNQTSSSPKSKVWVGNEAFQFYEGGSALLQWVDGALPWIAAAGEKTDYVHLIKPPEYIDREATGKEVELFRGRYVSLEEMLAAVPKGTTLPKPSGVYSCQPYVPSAWTKAFRWVGIVFLIINIALLIYSSETENPSTILDEKIESSQYEAEHLSKPFQVKNDSAVLRLGGWASVNNSWVAVDFGVVDAEDRVVGEFFDEASYYSGRDSEGAWSEGSQRFSSYFRIAKAGEYRLLVHGQGGSGENGPAKKEAVTLTLQTGVTMSRYFIWPLLLAGLFVCAGWGRREAFENRRWRPVMKDDDD